MTTIRNLINEIDPLFDSKPLLDALQALPENVKGHAFEEAVVRMIIPMMWPNATDIEHVGGDNQTIDFKWTVDGVRFYGEAKNLSKPMGRTLARGYYDEFIDRRDAGEVDRMVFFAMNGLSSGARKMFSDKSDFLFTEVTASTLKARGVNDKWTYGDLRDLIRNDVVALIEAVSDKPLWEYNALALKHILAAVDNGLHESPIGGKRAWVNRPTGSGKTRVFTEVIRELAPDITLVGVPTIALGRQTVNEIAKEIGELDYLMVSSGRFGDDDYAGAIGVTETTDKLTVQSFLSAPGGRKVIVACYDSIKGVLIDALDGITVDLAIFDEAHRMTSVHEVSKIGTYTAGLYDENVTIDTRLFFTATPRVTDIEAMAKAEEKAERATPDETIVSHDMSNTDFFGEEIVEARMTLYEAILDPAVAIVPFDMFFELADDDELKALLERDARSSGFVAVNEFIDEVVEEGNEGLDDTESSSKAIAYRDVFAAIMLLRHAKPGQSVLTFHNRIEKANRFAGIIRVLADVFGVNVEVMAVNGTTSATNQDKAIDLLAKRSGDDDAIRIVTNCKLFGEGIDAPALDCVMFADPIGSLVDIIQSIGRALRGSPGKEKADILFPMFVDGDDDKARLSMARSGAYANMFSVAAVLRDLDTRLTDVRKVVSIVPNAKRVVSDATKAPKRTKPVTVNIKVPDSFDASVFDSLGSIVVHGEADIGRLDDDVKMRIVAEWVAEHPGCPPDPNAPGLEGQVARALAALIDKGSEGEQRADYAA